MTITIEAVGALNDNYIWLIIQNKQAIVVDPGQAAPVDEFLAQHDLQLSAIWITHDHNDHVGGVNSLLERHHCPVYAHSQHQLNVSSQRLKLIDEGDELAVGVHRAQVWRTFGHTDSHLSFVLAIHDKTHVFCGDTLFNAGCGRVFTGTMKQLFDSFAAYNQLPDDTLFYAAHEYTLSNLKFAKALSPNNSHIDDAIIYYTQKLKAGDISLPTDLGCQKRINPFLQVINQDTKQFDVPALTMHHTSASEFDAMSDLDKFALIRKLKDNF